MDGRALQEALDEAGMSVPALARELGLSRQAVGAWIHGRVPPGKVADVRRVLRITVDLSLVDEIDMLRELERRAYLRRG